MSKAYWLVPLTAVTAGLAFGFYLVRRRGLARVIANLQTFSIPSAWFYDALFSLTMVKFYARVAKQIAAEHPTGSALDVGCGPGHVAVHLAQVAPGLAVAGLDISPAMVERARLRAMRSKVADRVHFEVGDVAALPFPDEHFDVVFSSFSLHHWSDPVRGLGEVYRVLKPAGKALIYDVADWALSAAHHLPLDHEAVVAASPFGKGRHEVVPWPGPVPLIYRDVLTRPAADLQEEKGR